ncbi:hypothetical protein ACFLYF_05240, partial [Chloroflexota bacterium]
GSIQKDASDLHLATGYRPTARVHGQIEPLDNSEIMTPESVLNIFRAITPRNNGLLSSETGNLISSTRCPDWHACAPMPVSSRGV